VRVDDAALCQITVTTPVSLFFARLIRVVHGLGRPTGWVGFGEVEIFGIFSRLGWVMGRKNCLSNAYAKLT